MTNESKAIRHLEQKADKGDISAIFQLYQYFSSGKETDIDESESQKYFNDCVSFLSSVGADKDEKPCNKIRINRLSLFEFRKFKEFSIDFDQNLTVVIGGNGAGKSSILESIAKTLSWIVSGIEVDGKVGRPFTYLDINNDSTHYGEITSHFLFGQSIFTSSLSRAIKGASEKKGSKVTELKELAAIWRVVNHNRIINLPLFAYYSVGRSINKTTIKSSIDISSYDKFDAYNDSLNDAGRVDQFIEWFISINKKGLKYPYVGTHLVDLEEQISSLNHVVSGDKNHPLKSVLNELFTKRNMLLALKNHNEEDALNQLGTVKLAIMSAIPQVRDIFIESSSGSDEVILFLNGRRVTFQQLSDGQRTYIALIADLSRRLVMLNPNLKNPLNGQGIVLIDEIELHLHPSWQQIILLKLQQTFPNIQFIVTTHSPQVLSTVDRKCIRILDEAEGIAREPDFQTKGVMSSEVLDRIMGTKSTPPIQEVDWLNEMQRFIQENKYEEEEAKELFDKLKKHFGENHPLIHNLNAEIRFQELKLKVNGKISLRPKP